MIAPIYINGLIGSYNGLDGVDLVDVVSQVAKYPEANEYRVYINSEGGVCAVGYSIYSYLKSLSKPVTTVANGICASIATIVFLAGERRLINDGTSLMIHNPWGDGIKGDADVLELAAIEMRAEEDKMIAMYSKVTGITKDGLDSLMKNETYLNADKAIELGFATEKINQRAVAYLNTNNMSKTIMAKLDEILSSFSKKQIMAMDLTSADGKKVVVEFADGVEDGMPETGDKISVDGTPLSGEVVMSDGSTVKAEGGVVTEVVPVVAAEEPAAEPTELEALKAELESYKAKVAVLETDKEEFETKTTEKLAMLEGVLKNTKTRFEPMAAVTTFKEVVEADAKAEMQDRKKLYRK